MHPPPVTESGGPAARHSKANKEASWWKGKSALFRRLAGRWGRVDSCLKADFPTDSQWARAFIDGGRGLLAETAQSALIVILKLVMQWSDQRHLDCFKYS